MAERNDTQGRVAQRRRTRKAIIQAAIDLMTEGKDPSITDVATRAEVSKRTIYMYFSTLDHLLIDATLGALTAQTVDSVVDAAETGDDVEARVDTLVRTLIRQQDEQIERLGRRLMRLTVESPPDEQSVTSPRRGYRRVEWIESALAPLRERMDEERFERLVSALTLVIGWEAMLALRDIRGLDRTEEEEVSSWAARALVRAMLDEVNAEAPEPERSS